MLFGSDRYSVELSDYGDAEAIADIYNSNKEFLKVHTPYVSVTPQWVQKEIETMKSAGFVASKIKDNLTNEIVGVLDFQIADECYLSLLMLRADTKKKGTGAVIFHLFEEYARTHCANMLRIDVVLNYDPNVTAFWEKQGFLGTEEVTLNWNRKKLNALKMNKLLL